MDQHQRQILERNRILIIKNLILTDEFYELLRTDSVLPDTMIRDVQGRKTREDRNSRLLETLMLRGCDSFRKFRHVLYLTGHLFIADQLYEDESDSKALTSEEIFTQFPNIFKRVSDQTKAKLLRFLDAKVKQRSLEHAWNSDAKERIDNLESRKSSFEYEREFKQQFEEKKKKEKELTKEVERLHDELKKRNIEMESLEREVNEMRKGYKMELDKQARFNAANNNSVLNLRERLFAFNDKIKVMNHSIRQFLKDTDIVPNSDLDDIRISMLEENVQALLQVAKSSMESTSSSAAERNTVLSMLQMSEQKNYKSVSDIVKKFLAKEEKAKLSILSEIEELFQILKGKARQSKTFHNHASTDFKFLKMQIATIRVEVEHLKKKLEWKDAQITDLIQENSTLRGGDPPVEKPQTDIERNIRDDVIIESPETVYEMNMAYGQYERYPRDVYRVKHDSPVRRASLAEVSLERTVSPTLAVTRKGTRVTLESVCPVYVGENSEENKQYARRNNFVGYPKLETEDGTHRRSTVDLTPIFETSSRENVRLPSIFRESAFLKDFS
ncbi:hypothetical protein CHS0354_032782 [Potamilus streckersoni]|uniref:CARD domain-containing protein n=1 Tax=Potamilus streckersoni TaxID=2493646 RepID=A0AAE0VSJ6_9BIVA|nr:hypothetical protein CHS0354_032782 [Potamilus streckersoni]